jgi:2,4-dienoyl-CoA reductase-like NADH-dependent reductase (Old Yellow Enzyme family)
VDGAATDWHLVHLGSRAVGGAGLVVAEASAVSPEGRITPGDAGIWANKHVEPVARINRFIKEHGAAPGIQIAHAGRKASAARPWEGGAHLADDAGGWPVIAPSALAFGGELTKVPRAMSLADIARVQGEFVAAAKRSLAAGCEWLELHAAHGYWIGAVCRTHPAGSGHRHGGRRRHHRTHPRGRDYPQWPRGPGVVGAGIFA